MAKLFDSHRRLAERRDRSSIGAFLGGRASIDRERAYKELQAAFAEPLHLSRDPERISRRAEGGRTAPQVHDEPGGLLGLRSNAKISSNSGAPGDPSGLP